MPTLTEAVTAYEAQLNTVVGTFVTANAAASGSATAAADSATTASTQAGIAATKAGEALASKDAAGQSAFDANAIKVDLQTNWGDKLATATSKATESTDSAAASEASRQASGVSAGLAATAKTAAELARDAAQLSAGIYSSVAVGLAATVSGQYFSVPVSTASVYLILYLNNAGSAVEAKRYPSAVAVPSFKGSVTAAASLASVMEAGVYYLTASAGYTDMPVGIDATKAYNLFVTATVDTAGRWYQQEMCRLDRPEEIWTRRLDATGTGTTAWYYMPTVRDYSVGTQHIQPLAVARDRIAEKAVTRAKLADEFDFQGVLSTGDANAQITSGTYLVTAALSNMPVGAPVTGYLIVRALNTASFVLQEFVSLTGVGASWRRYMRPLLATPIYGAWTVPDVVVTDSGITNIKIADKAVTRAKLSDSFSYAGVITSATDANALTVAGEYLATSKPVNGASASGTSGYLVVENYNSASFVVQTWRNILNPEQAGIRYIRPAMSEFGAWKSLAIPASTLPFAGKNIVCIGDSITELGDYPERVAARTGASVTKIGFGGCRMGKHSTTSDGLLYDKMCMYQLARYINTGTYTELTDAAAALFAQNGDDNRPQAAALAAINWAAMDIVVIAFGTNDWAGNVPLGSASDADGTTFRGAINYTVDKLLSAYPHLKIAFVAPMWRSRNVSGDGLDADTNPNTNGAYLLEFTDAVIDRANANKLPALDMYRESGVNKYNHTTLLTDGLHPIAGIGYQRVADKVSGLLSSVF